MKTIQVLVVDDSGLICRIVTRALEQDPHIEVVGTARSAREALQQIRTLRPDVLTLDLEMPGMNGLDLLQQLARHRPVPVVVFSAMHGPDAEEKARAARRAGAVAVIEKPPRADRFDSTLDALRRAIHRASRVDMSASKAGTHGDGVRRRISRRSAGLREPVVVVGSSTGGPQALMRFVERLPDGIPGVVIAQHIMVGFSESLAVRLGQRARMPCAEARPGVLVEPGSIWLAPATHHVRLIPAGQGFRLQIDQGPLVNGHRPSVDVLFESAARVAGSRAIGVLLTGMGRDGARGLLAIRRAGGRTFAQDEATSVVYGMPKAAAELGAAERILPLDELPLRVGDAARQMLGEASFT